MGLGKYARTQNHVNCEYIISLNCMSSHTQERVARHKIIQAHCGKWAPEALRMQVS